MTRISHVLGTFALLLSGLALAQHEQMELKLAIDENGTQDDVVVRIDSEKDGFSLKDLQVGESRSLTAEDGRPVLVTRTDSGFDMNVDGRTIKLPAAGSGGDRTIVRQMHGDMKFGEDGKHIIKKRVAIAGDSKGTTIISPEPLDEATRSSIEASLAAAGIHDVRFISYGDMNNTAHLTDDHEVRIVKIEQDTTN